MSCTTALQCLCILCYELYHSIAVQFMRALNRFASSDMVVFLHTPTAFPKFPSPSRGCSRQSLLDCGLRRVLAVTLSPMLDSHCLAYVFRHFFLTWNTKKHFSGMVIVSYEMLEIDLFYHTINKF